MSWCDLLSMTNDTPVDHVSNTTQTRQAGDKALSNRTGACTRPVVIRFCPNSLAILQSNLALVTAFDNQEIRIRIGGPDFLRSLIFG